MNCTPFVWCLAADYPFPFVNQFLFYHITSHYLCHKVRYRLYLVEIALGCSRNLMVYCKRFTLTFWPKWFLIPLFRPAKLVSFVFHLLTIIHRMSIQRHRLSLLPFLY